jgi:hypothetical protein
MSESFYVSGDQVVLRRVLNGIIYRVYVESGMSE